jgi:uncharacterized protein with HEPN domain
MRSETRAGLADARAAAEEVFGLATPDWQESRTVGLAIERLLMIVGEGLSRVRQNEPSILDAVTDSHKIIGMRNLLVHGYDDIDPERIQDAIDLNLPRLIAELDALLGRGD